MSDLKKIAVVGSGSWGSALASTLADKGHDVTIWGIETDVINQINTEHKNTRYLPNAELPASLKGTLDIAEAVSNADVVVMSVPSQAVRENIKRIKPYLSKNTIIVNTAKGFEVSSHKRLCEVIREEVSQDQKDRIVVLSGPSHAEEVAVRMPTAVVVAGYNMNIAEEIRDIFMTRTFRIYVNDDLIGVEICGALKNAIALSIGIIDGLGYGDNTKAAIMTRGLAEITRLGLKMGAMSHTFNGLAGIGDLIVTCTSPHSRNRRAGIAIGNGQKLDDVLANMGMVVEGVNITEISYELSREYDVEMPLINECYAILFEGRKVEDATDILMSRAKNYEISEN